MIISHQHKFIFIKTHKTAGSSMEMALAPLCGPDDIITPMESNAKSSIPRNYHEKHILGRLYAQSRLIRKCIPRHCPLLGAWYYEHMPALRVRELVGEKIWNSYKTFCYERNPWAKVVSYYNWKKNGQGRKMPTFEEYVMKKSHRLPIDARLYFDGEHSIVDEVYDYQSFEITFPQVCEKLGIPLSGSIPKEKTGVKQEKTGGYQEYYNDETREHVGRLFSREIDLMGYTF